MLTKESVFWSIDFLKEHGDGDLFPKLLEIDAISEMKEDFFTQIDGNDLRGFKPGPCRRFIVPKDEVSFRPATQLDPQDNIILNSIIFQFGEGIEARRLTADKVYSYRFAPDVKRGLYSNINSWNKFWRDSLSFSAGYNYVLYCDIADFYNQIYHHVIENQLIESGFPNQVSKWIITLLEKTTSGVSRGVPVGPHPIHLLAEMALIPIDNSMLHQGLVFKRYVDDILIFCDSENAAMNALYKFASILDKQNRLVPQRHKTKIYTKDGFQTLCEGMIEDRPISRDEDKVLKLIKRYSDGDPYKVITYNQISSEDWRSLSEGVINKIIYEYLGAKEIDFVRLRWFYRRLSQIGHPGAIEISLNEMGRLTPCFANICFYLSSVQSIEPNMWKDIGGRLLELLNTEIVQSNEYFRLSILSLFTKNKHINHFSVLSRRLGGSAPFERREIILSAYQNGAFDWLRELKESYQVMDDWQKLSFIYAISGLPYDEKKYFINAQHFTRPFEVVLSKWSKKQG